MNLIKLRWEDSPIYFICYNFVCGIASFLSLQLVSLLSETDFLNVLVQLTDTDSTSRKAIMVLLLKNLRTRNGPLPQNRLEREGEILI